MTRWATVALPLLAVACAPLTEGPLSFRAPDWKPTEVREPAVFVRLSFVASGPKDDERQALEMEYLGALLDALNRRAVAPRDARVVRALDPAAAVARAREVGADAAILVGVEVDQAPRVFCRAAPRPFRATAVVWRPHVRVLRASDGATRLTLADPDLDVTDVEADCDNPRASRRRAPAETLAASLGRILPRLVGP